MDFRSKIKLANRQVNLVGSELAHHNWYGLGYRRRGSDTALQLRLLEDSHIGRGIHKRVDGLVARTLLIGRQGNGSLYGDERLRAIAQRAVSVFDFENFCRSMMPAAMVIGFAVARLDWDYYPEAPDLLLPKWRIIPSERFTWVEHEPENRNVPTATGETLDPASEIVVIAGHELRLLSRGPYAKGRRCPKGRYVVLTYNSMGMPWGFGEYWRLRLWHTIRKECIPAMLLVSDRVSSNPTIGTYPGTLDPANVTADRELIESFETFLEAIAPSSWVSMPEGFTVQTEGIAQAMSVEVQKQMLDLANTEISKILLGDRPYSDRESGGSYAAESSQVGDRDTVLTDADCNSVDGQMMAQLWTPIYQANLPGNVIPSGMEIPVVRRECHSDYRDQEILGARNEALEKLVDVEAKLRKFGLRRDLSAFVEAFGTDLQAVPPEEKLQAALTDPDSQVFKAVMDLAIAAHAQQIGRDEAIALLVAMGIDEGMAARFIASEPRPVTVELLPVEPLPASSSNEFSEGDLTPTEQAIAADLSDLDQQGLIEEVLEPVLAAIDGAGSYDEAMEAIIDAYPEMNTDNLAEVLGDRLFAACAVGRIEVIDEARNSDG